MVTRCSGIWYVVGGGANLRGGFVWDESRPNRGCKSVSGGYCGAWAVTVAPIVVVVVDNIAYTVVFVLLI